MKILPSDASHRRAVELEQEISVQDYEKAQASLSEVGVFQMVAAHIDCVKRNMGTHYAQCMADTEVALYQDTQLFDVRSSLYDIEDGAVFTKRVLAAVVGGEEIAIEPDDPRQWHCPKNEREYLRSPQRAQWRSAKEGKMDQYRALGVFKLVSRKGLNPKSIMGSLWAYKIASSP